MATVKVVDLISRAQVLLKDTTAVRWTAVELQLWLNDAYRELVNVRPDVNAQVGIHSCSAGFRQTITSTFPRAERVLEITYNTAVTSNKKAIRVTDRRSMDEQLPNWLNDIASVNAERYMFDPKLPKQFLVYPPATVDSRIEVVYSEVPLPHTLTEPQLTNPSTTTVINVDDGYANALLDYMLYRAYTKDSEQTGNATRAMAHYQAMLASLGAKTQSDQSAQPG
jgi:hypothetical protein